MASAEENGAKNNIVIVGGGIIGCSTAYFLTRHPLYSPKTHSITLLEATKIAGGASGKAGGLLALWAYPSNLVPLSYKLHAQLAEEHGGAERWGYRRIHCAHIDAKGRPVSAKQSNGGNDTTGLNGASKQAISLEKRPEAARGSLVAAGAPSELDWLSPDSVLGYDEMGTPDTTAQVHPYQFTTSMASLATEAGARIVEGARVTSIDTSGKGAGSSSVESVTYVTSDGETKSVPASTVVLAAGPWTKNILPSVPVSGLRAHSVTIRPTRPVSAFALFTQISLPADFSSKSRRPQHVAPEIYARPNNEVYACGEGDRLVPLPSSTSEVKTDDSRCQDIIDHVGSISDELRDGEITARQACYLPVSDNGGGPFIGEVRDMKGLVLATGHTCWGIQNAPGTGKVVSEIVMGGKAESTKLGMLDPKRGM